MTQLDAMTIKWCQTQPAHSAKQTNPEGTSLIPRQMGDFLIGTTDESIAARIIERIGKRVKFQHEENLTITFLGLFKHWDRHRLVQDCNGADVKILMSSKGHLKGHSVFPLNVRRTPPTHDWKQPGWWQRLHRLCELFQHLCTLSRRPQ